LVVRINPNTVLRATINATERSDLRVIENDLRKQCEGAGLDAFETEKLIGRAIEVLAELLERGSQLVSEGAQLRTVREIRIDGHVIKLVFQTTGSTPTFLERLVRYLFG
jgi:hypothetical protein